MARRACIGLLYASLAAVAASGFAAVPALAARPATDAEREAIERVVMAGCEASQPGCRWGDAATVSTVDEAFAFAGAGGEYMGYEALLRRGVSGEWSIAQIQGGGVLDCRDWYRAASPRVVADLGLSGLLLDGSGELCPGRVLSRKGCGSIPTVSEGVRARARIRARGVSCSFARRAARRNARGGGAPRRWSCIGSGEGALCVRGKDASVAASRRWALRFVPNVRSDLRIRASASAISPVVSLGDSFSSGEGAGPYDRGTSRTGLPENGCHRSRKAWPRLLGVSKGDHLACSGARIRDLTETQGKFGAVPDGQLNALARRAESGDVGAVLITMGGNDLAFETLVRQCWQHSVTGAGCVDDVAKARGRLADVQQQLTDAYETIVTAADGAPVVVAGYPDIVPAFGERLHRCGWLSKSEHVEIDNLMGELDRMVRRAVRAAGETYVSVRDVLDGNELCTKDPHVRPIMRVIGDESKQEMAHPDAAGQRALADAVRPVLRRVVRESATVTGTLAPEGVGRVRLGMTTAQVIERFGPPSLFEDGDIDVGALLGYGGTGDEPDLELEFCADGALTAFAVTTPGLADGKGVRVGTPLRKLRNRWGSRLRELDEDYFVVRGDLEIASARCGSTSRRPVLAYAVDPTQPDRPVEYIEGGYGVSAAGASAAASQRSEYAPRADIEATLDEIVLPERAVDSYPFANTVDCRRKLERRYRCTVRAATLDGDVEWTASGSVRKRAGRYRYALRGTKRLCAPAGGGCDAESFTWSGRGCGFVTNGVDGEGEGAGTAIHAVKLRCNNARGVARRCLRGERGGYRRSSGLTGRTVLRRGQRLVSFAVIGGGGCTR